MKLLDYRQFVDRIGSIYFSQIKYFYKKVKEKRGRWRRCPIISFRPLSFDTLPFSAQSYKKNNSKLWKQTIVKKSKQERFKKRLFNVNQNGKIIH